MSCKNKNCCNNTREELLSSNALASLGAAGAQMAQQLMSIAARGAADFSLFKDQSWLDLARQIARLYDDRARLLNLFDGMLNVDFDRPLEKVTLHFGPDQRYQLITPVAGKLAKLALADSLREVADELEREHCHDAQMPLPLED